MYVVGVVFKQLIKGVHMEKDVNLGGGAELKIVLSGGQASISAADSQLNGAVSESAAITCSVTALVNALEAAAAKDLPTALAPFAPLVFGALNNLLAGAR